MRGRTNRGNDDIAVCRCEDCKDEAVSADDGGDCFTPLTRPHKPRQGQPTMDLSLRVP
jgi:hypothetical protein